MLYRRFTSFTGSHPSGSSYTDYPYCAGYTFRDGNRLLDCKELEFTSIIQVEDLDHFYATATEAPTATDAITSGTFDLGFGGTSTSTGDASSSATRPVPTSTSSSSPSGTTTVLVAPASHHGVAPGVIGGVVAGVGVAAIGCGLIIFLCIRNRNSRRAQPATHAAQPPPRMEYDQKPPVMQQQPVGVSGHQSLQPQYNQSPQGPVPAYSTTEYQNPQIPAPTYTTTVSPGPPSPIKLNSPSYDQNHRTSTTTSPYSPVPSPPGGNESHPPAHPEPGYFQPPHPSPSPPPTIGAESNMDAKTMNNPPRVQSPPASVSEVPGTTTIAQGSPTQTHPYTTSNYSVGQPPEVPRVLQPGARPPIGPWELGNRS